MKLSQALAREQQEKSRAAEAYKWFQQGIKTFVMDGFIRSYQANDAEGEALAPEEKVVQWTWKKLLSEMRRYVAKYVDSVATKDYANRSAVADVVVDSMPLITDAPVPFLLFLEKHLADWRAFIQALPARDRGRKWHPSDGGLMQTEPVFKNRSIKQQVPIVLYDATPEHPAQTQLLEKAVTVGQWNQVDFSGQPSDDEKEEIIERIDKLIAAVKSAREQANGSKIEDMTVSRTVFDYILG